MFPPLKTAFDLLLSGDREVYFIVWTSLRITLVSTVLASAISVPTGVMLGLSTFRGKRFLIAVLNSLMAVPTVVVGLIVYSFLSRSGPFGRWGILFSPSAIVIGQVVLSFPIVTSFVYGSLSRMDRRLPETLITLGARRFHIVMMVVREARAAILSAILAGFARVIGEVGISMMLGGNIRWYTRTITTAIALETSRGDFELGLALGIILLLMALGLNLILHSMVRRDA